MRQSPGGPGRRVDEVEALRLMLLERTLPETGTGFLRALVRNLCQALDAKGAWVTEYIPDQRRLRSLAFWCDGAWVEHYEYDVEGTPCQPVVDSCARAHFPDRVIELFPRDPDLPPLGAVSYLGVPILDSGGAVLGHLAVLDDKPMPGDSKLLTVFEAFAERASAEVRRLRAEQAVRIREEQLSSLIDSAMDAVLVVDRADRIVRSNPAAGRIFSPERGALEGLEVGRFLDEDCARLVRDRIDKMEASAGEEPRYWFPRGLTARRASGEEFTAEATLSRFEAGREIFHVLILRDVNDRIRIENRLRILEEEADFYRQAVGEPPGDGTIIGRCPAMKRLFKAMRQVSATDATVLILGETGTGKELIAHSIHHASSRKEGPLVRVNCAAIPGTLMESEFFGHERGAFTGAAARRDGRFALADGGTIFLDEVGELPLDLQGKLLRVLQEGEFEPLGGTRTRKVDVRVIAATHRSLEEMIREGSFREDLYYRLNVFPLTAPPLRDRTDDIPLLAEEFARRFARRMGRRIEELGPAEIQMLKGYSWPGNVRELQNVIERALILAEGGRLDLGRAMPGAAAGSGVRPAVSATARDITAPAADRVLTAKQMQEQERENLIRALTAAGWKISGSEGAARLLGMPTSTLTSRMKALKIRRPRPAD